MAASSEEVDPVITGINPGPSKRPFLSRCASPNAKRVKTTQATLHRFMHRRERNEDGEGFSKTGTSKSSSITFSKVAHPLALSGLKIFSPSEIEKAKGLEKHFRLFWNKMARDIYNDKVTTSMLNSKAEATGIIHTSWVLHKVDLLQIDVDEIHILAEQVYTPKQIDAQFKAVDKNMKRTVMARLAINEANGKLKAADTNPKMQIQRRKIEDQMRELKKAQDALKKAIARKRQDIHLLKAKLLNQADSDHTSESDNQLSDNEMERIVADVKDEFTPLSPADNTDTEEGCPILPGLNAYLDM